MSGTYLEGGSFVEGRTGQKSVRVHPEDPQVRQVRHVVREVVKLVAGQNQLLEFLPIRYAAEKITVRRFLVIFVLYYAVAAALLDLIKRARLTLNTRELRNTLELNLTSNKL